MFSLETDPAPRCRRMPVNTRRMLGSCSRPLTSRRSLLLCHDLRIDRRYHLSGDFGHIQTLNTETTACEERLQFLGGMYRAADHSLSITLRTISDICRTQRKEVSPLFRLPNCPVP